MDTLNTNSEPLIISEQSLSHLNITRKWAKFLAILGFISLGLLLIIGLGMLIGGVFIKSMGSTSPLFILIGLLYLVLAGITLVPNWYLYKFCVNTEKMINYREAVYSEQVFRYLMAFYRFVGIMTVVILALYLLAAIVTAITMFSTASVF